MMNRSTFLLLSPAYAAVAFLLALKKLCAAWASFRLGTAILAFLVGFGSAASSISAAVGCSSAFCPSLARLFLLYCGLGSGACIHLSLALRLCLLGPRAAQ